MPPKKKLVTQYRWHRVPQYLRDRPAAEEDSSLPPEDVSGNKTPTSSADIQSRRLRTGSVSQPNLNKKDAAVAESDDKGHPPRPSIFAKLLNLRPWTFTPPKEPIADNVVLPRVTSEHLEESSEKRRSTWVLVDNGSSSEDEEEDNPTPSKKKKKSSLNYQEVVTISGEIPIEAVILPKDRSRLDFNLFWKDVDTFLEEIEVFLSTQVRNWVALRGDGVRPWHAPTTLHSWWGEWGTFLSGYHDPSYWIERYPSHLPSRYVWDMAIGRHSAVEEYYAMRRRHKAPPHLSWSCEGLDKREEERNILWSCYGYSNTPSKFDFDVKVEALMGSERLSKRTLLGYILSQKGVGEMLSAARYYMAWGSGRIPIHHYTDKPSLGGAFTDALELPWVTLHNCFPELKELLYENVEPLEWQVYRHCIEDDPGLDPDLDVVHAYTNYDVRGGPGVKDYYDGQQYIICDRFQEDYDQPSGDWWYFPRNYRYEMQRGIGHISDNYNRTRSPLYERMIELSAVGGASDPKPPWRKGSFQNLGWFLDQFQFHFLPFMRRTKVALDLLTRPFAYRETSLSRLDATLHLLSRSCRILTKSNFSPEAWTSFKTLVKVRGDALSIKMSSLLTTLTPLLKLFRVINAHLSWASSSLEPAQSHWRILVGRSYYLLGLFRFDFLHGVWYNRHFKDRYYGVPGLYSGSRHRRQLDPYHSYWLEQWPLKKGQGQGQRSQGDASNFIPGSETPPRPSFVGWDDAQGLERIPWNLIWFSDKNIHLQAPLEARTVAWGTLKGEGQVEVIKELFKNAEDVLELAREELDGAMGAIYKYKDDKEVVWMSPTGPVGPRDPGYQNLLRLLTNPDRVNPLDTYPLQPFDTLLSQWKDVVGAAAQQKFRHMLGPGAYRLSQSLEQVFDLHQEVHLILPHLEKLANYLATNGGAVGSLGTASSKKSVALGLFRSPKLIPFCTPRPFYVVRFSVGRETNVRIGREVDKMATDTGGEVEDKLEGWYYLKNQRYEGFVGAGRQRRRVARVRRRWRMDRALARMVGVEVEVSERGRRWEGGGGRREDLLGGCGVRRHSSAELFYLEDDRPERRGRYEVGRSGKKMDKLLSGRER